MKFLESELTFTEMMDEEWYFVLFIARSENTYILSFINIAILLSKRIIVAEAPESSGGQMNQGEPQPSIAPLGATPSHMVAFL